MSESGDLEMALKVGDDKPEDTKDLVIKLGEIIYTPVYEPKIPREITDGILAKEKIPQVPQLGSSMIEDFIIRKMREGDTTNDDIVEAFISEDVPSQIASFIQEVQETSNKIGWEQVFNERDVSEAQTAVLLEMREVGMNEEQIAEVAKMKPQVLEGIGVSSLG